MSDKKGWGSTVAGWFIEREEPMGSAGIEADPPGAPPVDWESAS